MTRHYSHKEWKALPMQTALAFFNDSRYSVVRTSKEIRVTRVA